MQVKKQIKNWGPAVIVAAIIFTFSSLHGTTIKSSGLGYEPIQVNAHFFLYFALGITLYKATNNIVLTIVLAFIYSLSDEIHQTFVPGRTFQIFDIFVDTIGASIAGGLLWRLYSHLPMTLKNWLAK